MRKLTKEELAESIVLFADKYKEIACYSGWLMDDEKQKNVSHLSTKLSVLELKEMVRTVILVLFECSFDITNCTVPEFVAYQNIHHFWTICRKSGTFYFTNI